MAEQELHLLSSMSLWSRLLDLPPLGVLSDGAQRVVGVVLREVLLELVVCLDAIDEELVTAVNAKQRVHGATASGRAEVAARNYAKQLACTLHVQRQRCLTSTRSWEADPVE